MTVPAPSQMIDESTLIRPCRQVDTSSSVSNRHITQLLDDITRTCFMDTKDVVGVIVNSLEGFRETSFIAKHKNPQTLLRVAISPDRKTKYDLTENEIDSCLIEFDPVVSSLERSKFSSDFHIKGDSKDGNGAVVKSLPRHKNVIFILNDASKEAIVNSAVLCDLDRNKEKCEPNLAQEKGQTKLLFKIIWVHFSVRIRVNVFTNTTLPIVPFKNKVKRFNESIEILQIEIEYHIEGNQNIK